MSDDAVSAFLSGKSETLSQTNTLESSEYDETPCYGKRRDKRPELTLDVRLKNGKRYGISYSFLVSCSIDGEDLALSFTYYSVLIRGKNLKPLYEALLEFRLRWIKEEGDRFEPQEPRTFIASIDVLSARRDE